MNTSKIFICILFFPLILTSCHNGKNVVSVQEQKKTSPAPDSIVVSRSDSSFLEIPDEDLYVLGENRRGSNTKLASNVAQKEVKTTVIGENTRELYFYFIDKRVVSIVDRLTDKTGEKLSNIVYDFDEKNRCVSVDYRNIGSETTISYGMYSGQVIKYDVGYHQFPLAQTEKKLVIQQIKDSLNSYMQVYPEFKCSIDWK
jgi:hypothetical protein